MTEGLITVQGVLLEKFFELIDQTNRAIAREEIAQANAKNDDPLITTGEVI